LSCTSAEYQRNCQAAFGGFFVLGIHLFGRERHRLDGCVEVDPAVGGDLSTLCRAPVTLTGSNAGSIAVRSSVPPVVSTLGAGSLETRR